LRQVGADCDDRLVATELVERYADVGSMGWVEKASDDAGDLQRGHVPAPTGEPHGVRTLAAADVEHPARCEALDLGDEGAVGPAAPQLPLPGVPLVPLEIPEKSAALTVELPANPPVPERSHPLVFA